MAESNLQSETLQALTAMQTDFVNCFVADDAAPFHELIAPTGTGKSYTATALLRRLCELRSLNRALVLAPASLQAEHLHRAHEAAIDLDLIRLDRKRLRELEEAVAPTENPWPARALVVSSLQFARKDDVASLLARTTWDLLIVDEAHHLRGRAAALVRQLVQRGCVQRLLLLTATPRDERTVADNIAITDWCDRVQELIDRLGSSIDRVDVHFSLSSGELDCLSRLREVISLLVTDGSARFLITILRRRAQSSLFTLEKTIRRMRNDLAHPAMAGLRERASSVDDQDTPEDTDTVEVDDRGPVWTEPTSALKLLSEFIGSLEALAIDSKLNALREILGSTEGSADRMHTCVFTAFGDTADYLASSLDELAVPVFRALGRMSPAQREQELRSFMEEGGVLLATDAGVQGCELSHVDTLVHYDQPEGQYAEERRIGRMWRFGRTKPLTVITLCAPDGVLGEGELECGSDKGPDGCGASGLT